MDRNMKNSGAVEFAKVFDEDCPESRRKSKAAGQVAKHVVRAIDRARNE